MSFVQTLVFERLFHYVLRDKKATSDKDIFDIYRGFSFDWEAEKTVLPKT
jgi:hypothetical protein